MFIKSIKSKKIPLLAVLLGTSLLVSCGGSSSSPTPVAVTPPPPPVSVGAKNISVFKVSTNVGSHRVDVKGATFTGECTPDVAGRGITWSGDGLTFSDVNSENVTITLDSASALATNVLCTLADVTSVTESAALYINEVQYTRFGRPESRFANLDMVVYTEDGAEETIVAGTQSMCDGLVTLEHLNTPSEREDSDFENLQVYGAAYQQSSSNCYILAKAEVEVDGTPKEMLLLKLYAERGVLVTNRYVSAIACDCIVDKEAHYAIPTKYVTTSEGRVILGGYPDANPGLDDVLVIQVVDFDTNWTDPDTGVMMSNCGVQATQHHSSSEPYGSYAQGWCGKPAQPTGRSSQNPNVN